MGVDLFNGSTAFGGAFQVDEATLTFAGEGGLPGNLDGLGAFVQNVQIQYSRPAQRMNDMGTNSTYYILSKPEGALQIGRLFAPKTVTTSFLKNLADVCNIQNNTLVVTAGNAYLCGPDGEEFTGDNVRLKMSNCLLSNLAFSMSLQSLAMAQNLSIMFSKLEIDDGSGNDSSAAPPTSDFPTFSGGDFGVPDTV